MAAVTPPRRPAPQRFGEFGSGERRKIDLPVLTPLLWLSFLRLRADKGFDRCAFFSFSQSMRADVVRADRCRNDKRFRVVHHERPERIRRALHDTFLAFNEVQNIDSVARVMRRHAAEPVPARLDEFAFVKAGTFFAPACAFRYGLHLRDQVSLHPCGRAIPLYVGFPMIEMDRPWPAIQAQASPIPELKSENVRGRADLQHHAVLAGAVDGASRNQEMVMFSCGPMTDILFGREGTLAALRNAQVLEHGSGINTIAQSKIDSAIVPCIQQVVAFVLRVVHTKIVLDVFRERVDLQREIATAHGVQKIKADGKFRPKSGVYGFTKKFARMAEYKIDGGNFDACRTKTQEEAVFLRDTIKTPGMIGLVFRKIAHFFHPMAAPRAGVKVRDDSEGPAYGFT